MKLILKAAAVAALATSALPALAQTAGGVVTVDINRLLAESAAGKSGVAQLQAKYNTVVQSQQTAFNSAATTYNTQVEAARKVVKPDGSGLTDAQRAQLGDAEQKLRVADEQINRTQNELNAVNNYVREQIIRAVVPIAEQVRAERRASVVVPRASVLAADPAADVTTVVLQRLDASLKTVSIALPQQQPAQGAAPAAARPATQQRPQTPQGR